MIAVVTGANGHLGANLVRALLAQGHTVRVLVHRGERALDGLAVLRFRGDVLDPATLRPAFDRADVVFHLAAVISIAGDPDGRVERVNVHGARNVAEAALSQGVGRLVHCASIHAFVQTDRTRPISEDTPRALGDGHFAYDGSKARGEAAVREVIGRGLDGVIVHPTAIIGPHDCEPSRMGQALLALARGSLPALVKGGYDWVDVRDVAAGMMAAADRGRTGESYILGGHWHAMREIASIVSALSGVAPPRLSVSIPTARLALPLLRLWSRATGRPLLYTRESLAALQVNPRVAIDKAVEALGHKPRPLRRTIADTLDWFAASGMLPGGVKP